MFSQKLIQKSSQNLVLSKQMQQSLKILQMTAVELSEYLSQEIVENPFLEMESDMGDLPHNDGGEMESDGGGESWHNESYLRYERMPTEAQTGINMIEAQGVSLKEHLLTHINILFVCNQERFIAYHLTDLLDESGYLRYTATELAEGLRCDESLVLKVRNKLQGIEPIGMFAYSLQECLRLQLEYQGITDQKFYQLLDNLEGLTSAKMPKILKALKITPDQLSAYLKKIRTLDPKPAYSFTVEPVSIRIADVIIYKNSSGTLEAKLNHKAFPSVLLNSQYFEEVYRTSTVAQEKKFCSEKLQSANWLLKSINQRANTILSVARQILTVQQDFFTSGISYLKPMRLTDIAQAVDMHESTISRISNKYIETPLGLFEIKYFFSNSLQSNIFENQISTRSVKNHIKSLVEQEKNTGKILKDEEIMEALNSMGINISRRTIVKYRKILKIAPSHIRKRNPLIL